MFVQLRVNIRDVQQCDVCDRVFGRRARVQRIGIRLFRARARRDDQQQRGEEAQRVMTPSGSKRKDRKHSTTKELWERKITPRWSVHEENEGEHALYSAIMQIYRIFKFSPKKRSEEHTSELQSRGHLVCRLLLEKKKSQPAINIDTDPH